jgi:hypothetical protein
MANDAFRRSGRAFIDAKMNARSRPDVMADFRANAVRAVVDHAAFKNLVPVEHGKSQRQAVHVSGDPASFLRWVNLSQPIRPIGENIRSDHGASPWFMKRKGLNTAARIGFRKGHAMLLKGRAEMDFGYDFVGLGRRVR